MATQSLKMSQPGEAGGVVPEKDEKTGLPLSGAFFKRMQELVDNSANDTRWMLAMTGTIHPFDQIYTIF